jgi:transketolase
MLNIDTYLNNNFYSLRKTIGQTLVEIGDDKKVIVVDAEVGNSTFTNTFRERFPERFFQAFIAEQNMANIAIGMDLIGAKVYISTFSAFLSRAFDQIRMSQYSKSKLKIIGTHCGISIGEDGPSQMGLEDLALFQSLLDSVVLYPSDSVSTSKLIKIQKELPQISYLRVTRGELKNIYQVDEEFKVGGSKVLFQTDNDSVTLISAGITVHESINAIIELKKQGINVRLIDLYSIKPIDKKEVLKAMSETGHLIVVEDHYPNGGIMQSVQKCFEDIKANGTISQLAVKILPRSGKPEELLKLACIDTKSIIAKVMEILSKK